MRLCYFIVREDADARQSLLRIRMRLKVVAQSECRFSLVNGNFVYHAIDVNKPKQLER